MVHRVLTTLAALINSSVAFAQVTSSTKPAVTSAKSPAEHVAGAASETTAHLFDRSFWITRGTRLTESAFDTSLQVAGILIVYFVVRAILNRMVNGVTSGLIAREERLGVPVERAGRLKTLSGLFQSMIGYVTFFVFGVLIFKAIGFDIMPFVTTAGVIGLAVGFGAQKLVKDVISGIFVIVDNMFVVGDTVTIGAVTGQVEEMGMRVTRLHDLTGRVVMISNGDIGQVINLSRYPVEDFVDVVVAPTFEMAAVQSAISAAADSLHGSEIDHLKARPQMVGITAFTATSVTIRISVIAAPSSLTREQMRVREAVREAFSKAGIVLA